MKQFHFRNTKIETQSKVKQNPGFPTFMFVFLFHAHLSPLPFPVFISEHYMSSFDLDSVFTEERIPDSPLTYSCPLNLAFTFVHLF